MKKINTLDSVLEELYDYVEIGDEAYWIRKEWGQKEKDAFIERVKEQQKELNSKEFKEWREKLLSKYEQNK